MKGNILGYLSGMGLVTVKDFPKDFKWLNTKEPLTLAKLKGQIVILDFWTYCCINCIHMSRELAEVENIYKNKPVIVIGVHSAKFTNEKDPKNIQNAIQRYDIKHPVIVDQEMKLWHEYGVNGWPTIIVIDPAGHIVYNEAGEGQAPALEELIDKLLIKHTKDNSLARSRIQIEIPPAKLTGVLSYPGKIAISPDGKTLAVSNSNRNRVLLVDMKTRKIKHSIGGAAGFKEGDYDDAQFYRPQGLAWQDDKTLFVADSGNHSVRMIDITNQEVKTIAGNGQKAGWLRIGGEGTKNPLNSPWDLTYSNKKLYIAMAGVHQVWVYDTEDKGVLPFAGSGFEGLGDGIAIGAMFAQPTGLTVLNNDVYVADSESSSIRRIDVANQKVNTLVGKGVFSFGFEDGKFADAKFQHPMGIFGIKEKLYVADTFNNAIREVDLREKTVSTLVGSKENPGVCKFDDPNCDTLGLYEPNDVKLSGDRLFIADTNNHLIRTFDLKTKILETFEIAVR